MANATTAVVAGPHKPAEAVYTGGVAITDSDVTVLDGIRGLYVGGAGAVAVRFLDGSIATFAAVPAGTILPFQVDQVRDTGTTATNIIGLR